ncbi:MAG: type II secretion system protein N [Legionella sp.]|nr:type II secretion system protein N [Legionella sp.]
MKLDIKNINIKYLKILAGVFLTLLILEWITGIRASMHLDKTTASHEAVPLNKSSMHKNIKMPLAINIQLFGDNLSDDADSTDVKRSALNISVVGILFASDEKKSHAMLALPDETVQLFRVGDKVPGGAVIKKITPEKILLLHDGALESLSLPENELFFSPPAAVLKQD